MVRLHGVFKKLNFKDQKEILIVNAPAGDAVVWFAYPKKSSKNYTFEFNRDSGWHVLGAAGFEGVRQVAIDQDWSALRFRRAEFIQSMTRDPKRALSKAGKQRTATKQREQKQPPVSR